MPEAFFYRVPAVSGDYGVAPDLSEAQGEVEYVAEYDRTNAEFVIRTDKAVRGLGARKVERPAHGVHAQALAPLAGPAPKDLDVQLAPPLDAETQAVYDRVYEVEAAALAAGKDPTKAAKAADKKLLAAAYARGERPRGPTS